MNQFLVGQNVESPCVQATARMGKIPYEILKHLPANATQILLNIFNNLYQHGEIIEDWRTALVKPIHKPKTLPVIA